MDTERSETSREIAEALFQSVVDDPDSMLGFLTGTPKLKFVDFFRRLLGMKSIIPLRFSPAQRSRFDRKARVYRLASLHLAISTALEKYPGAFQIAQCLAEFAPDVSQHDLQAAMDSLNLLSSTPNPTRTWAWARDWLMGIGVPVDNPITEGEFAMCWVINLTYDLETVARFGR
jgi:hypothetical protein